MTTMAIQRILCPTDPSSVGRRAALLSAALAARSPAARVLAFPIAAGGAEGSGRRPAGGGTIAEDLAVLIRQRAVEWDADLVVMGVGGDRVAGPDAGAAVTQQLLHRASCPVLILPSCDSARAEPRAESGRFRRVLWPSDFSAVAGRALEYALALADTDARLTLLHVLEWFQQGERGDFSVPEYQTDFGQMARERLRGALRAHARRALAAEEVVASGRPEDQILRIARDRCADLIVLGSHGRRAEDHRLPGSTVRQVIRRSHCPVLVVTGAPAAAVEGASPSAVGERRQR